jgi:hypothetical protein
MMIMVGEAQIRFIMLVAGQAIGLITIHFLVISITHHNMFITGIFGDGGHHIIGMVLHIHTGWK